MNEIPVETRLIAYCGLYCGACGKFRKGKCPACHDNEKATWCKVRTCCIEHSFTSCADCEEFSDPADCKKLNNFFSKVFAFILKSDRLAAVAMIRRVGAGDFARNMAEKGTMSPKK